MRRGSASWPCHWFLPRGPSGESNQEAATCVSQAPFCGWGEEGDTWHRRLPLFFRCHSPAVHHLDINTHAWSIPVVLSISLLFLLQHLCPSWSAALLLSLPCHQSNLTHGNYKNLRPDFWMFTNIEKKKNSRIFRLIHLQYESLLPGITTPFFPLWGLFSWLWIYEKKKIHNINIHTCMK